MRAGRRAARGAVRPGDGRAGDHGVRLAEQQQRFLPGIASGEVWWSQGYSEPGSGSDLASLKTKAERQGDYYIVNGQKTWTTLGQYGDWIFCLVRTSSEGKPQTGISFLLIDMKSPGVTVRPIITMDGEHEVNEVWFDNVEVPADNLDRRREQGLDLRQAPARARAHQHRRREPRQARAGAPEAHRQGRRRLRRRALPRRDRQARSRHRRARDDGAARALGREERQAEPRRRRPAEDPRQRDPAALHRADDARRRPGHGALHREAMEAGWQGDQAGATASSRRSPAPTSTCARRRSTAAATRCSATSSPRRCSADAETVSQPSTGRHCSLPLPLPSGREGVPVRITKETDEGNCDGLRFQRRPGNAARLGAQVGREGLRLRAPARHRQGRRLFGRRVARTRRARA